MIRQFGKRLRRFLQHRHLPWYLAVLAMVLCAPSLRLGWQTDDYLHRVALIGGPEFGELSRSPAELFAFIKGDEEVNRREVKTGYQPWWSHQGLRLAFFRPVTGLTHWIDYQLWPEFPSLMHLHSLVWLGGVVVAATFFYRRMLSYTWIAGLAALAFAVDDAHGLPAVWLANRNATIGVFFGLAALIAHDRWRADGWRMGAILAPLGLLLGLLSNEGVVATGGYLVAYALFLDRGTWVGRLRSLVPCALTGAIWWLAYKQMGYGAAGSGMYIDPGAAPVDFAQAVVARAPILLVGQWAIPSDLQLVLSQRAGQALWLVALGFLAVVAAALAPLVRRDPLARFFALGMVLAVLPACATFPSDRLLFFAGIGGMGLLAQFVAAVLERVDRLPTRAWWRLPDRPLCVVLIVIHLCAAPLALTQATGHIKKLGGVAARVGASLPSDPAVRTQTVLIVSTPTYYVSAFAPLMQALEGKAVPAHLFVLGSGIYPTEIRRVSERSLLIRPEGGFLAPPGSPQPGHEADQPLFDMRYGFPWFDRLFRGNCPMTIGQRIELTDISIEITAITEDGRPAEAAFHFLAELEDPSLRWLRWDDGVYAPFTVPAVGQTVTLPAVTVPF